MPLSPITITSRAWSKVSPTSATRRARPGASGVAPSTWARTHSAPARVLPAPRPPRITQLFQSPAGGSWCGIAQNSNSQGRLASALSLSPARNSSTSGGAAQASQAAPDLTSGRIEVEGAACPASSGDFLAKLVNAVPFLKHQLRGRAQLARQPDGLLQPVAHHRRIGPARRPAAAAPFAQLPAQASEILRRLAKQPVRDVEGVKDRRALRVQPATAPPRPVTAGHGQSFRRVRRRIEMHCHLCLPCPRVPVRTSE